MLFRSDKVGSLKDDRMKVEYIVDAVSHAHRNIPAAKSSYNPYKEIVATAARDNGLIDMETYQCISNKDRDRRNSESQKYYEWLPRPLSPPAESIDITGQKHAAENEHFFQDGHYVPGPLISKPITIRKEESEQSGNAVAVYVEEVGEDDNDESPPPQQRPPTEHDIALHTLTINKQMWLKEDEEYKRITSSEQSLSQHLAQDDVPLSRRSTAMVSAVIRDQEQREAWILKKASLKAKISLQLMTPSAPAFIPTAAAVVRAPSRSRSRSSHGSMSSCASISSHATAQEKAAEVGSIRRYLAVAVTGPPRSSVSTAAAAVGNDRVAAASTEPFPVFKKIESNERVMPVAEMEFRGRGTSSSNSASSDGGVSVIFGGVSLVPVVHGGQASSPVHGKNGACSQSTEIRLRDAVSEVRKTLAEVEVIPESPRENTSGDCKDAKMPDVEMVELSPDDIAKEA